MSGTPRSPRMATLLLRWVLPAADRDDVLGELDREYEECVVPARGGTAARFWYWRQVLGSILWHARQGGRDRRARRRGAFDRLRLDVRFAFRSFGRAPGFAALSVATIALGIGISTAVFSVLNGVVLRPLPYPDAHELVRLWPNWNLSKGVMVQLVDDVDGFSAIHGHVAARETLTGQGEPTELYGVNVTPGYLPMLGVVPARGRLFGPDETVPGRGDVVVLSEGTWRRLFGGAESVIGSTVELGGKTTTVVGVLPATFRPLIEGAEFWRPMRLDPDDFSDYHGIAQVTVVGRLSSGTTLPAASAAVLAVANAQREESPDSYGEEWVAASAPVSLHHSLVSTSRGALWTVMGAAGFLLLIACANVANLLLARAESRHREIAIRVGLGASAGRVARQLLTESTVMGMLGGAIGIGLAAAVLRSASAALPPGLPLSESVALDARVVAFALAATLLTSVLFGLIPALRASRLDPQRYLREASPSVSKSANGMRMNRLFVGAEIALAVVLAIGAGLMLRSLQEIVGVDTGIVATDVTTMRVRLPATSVYAGDSQRADFFGRLTRRLARTGGVRSAGAGTFLPMESGLISAVYEAEGVEYPPNQPPPHAAFQVVLGDYFSSLGIPLLAGRLLNADDVADGPTAGVINARLAEEAFGSVAAAVGKRIIMFGGGADFEVVGVVANSLQQAPGEASAAEAFFSYRQASWWPSMYLIVRAEPGTTVAADDLRAAVWDLDPGVPVLDVRPMDDIVRRASAGRRYFTLLLTGFGVLALVLGSIGVYGLMSYAVNERIYEFGIRSALGASRQRIMKHAVREAALPAILGVAAGCGLAAAMTGAMRGTLYGVAAHDPLTFGLVPVVLLGVALLASYLPARRAAAIDPKRLMSSE